ncbi:glycerol-3-phosphate-binding periplasmic protein precursor [Pusillimonas sp. T7-7]|uniref:extracellular solute-binding protein n=1 Tax=Pusillimonas sp. (strain T7-7) TaxID=1007105 RepID=UPI0002084B30|nr:extracellular solute-binding protein [Pusillimonas sp. T7-7]AEC19964.1 glycerol-3-phosphate-binding periplasmic protein precursor [Pusillimonas sp. T7-7]
MKLSWFFDALCTGRTAVCVSAGAILLSSTAAMAANDVVLWHSLNPHNKGVFEDLVKDFNKEQDEVRVKLKAFDNENAIEAALAAAKKRDDRPQLVQLDDDRSPEEVASRPYIQPLNTLLAKYPIKDAKWFLSEKNTFARDAKGRLLAFPYMVDIPVMYYNIDAFKKADLKPTAPHRDWAKLQDQLVTLANNGSRKCPLTSDQPVSINLENLAAVNNQLYTSNHNGLQGKGKPAFAFDVLYIRHLSMMISWVKSELMVKPEFNINATKRFANSECAVLFSTSSNIGWFRDSRKLDFSVSGLPYYPAITSKPGSAFVSGSAIWVTSGHSKESDAASAKFLSWLAQPKHAAQWHEDTGFLPLTEQAFAQTDKSYYKKLGDWRELIAVYEKAPGANGRGFRIDNYPQIRAMFHDTLEKALSGNQPAPTALKAAAAQASKMMSGK